jgi:hypothetical protein
MLALCAAMTLVAAGCGAPAQTTSPPPRSETSLPVLAPSAVPGISYTTRAVTAGDLSRDAPIAGLASKIVGWGYVDGRERTFQGESRQLTLVVSRTLLFRDAAGAHQFVTFVEQQRTAFFGGGVTERSLAIAGRSGWSFLPAPCACHMANPDLVGVLTSGPTVTWLEINGPAASQTVLSMLLDPAKSSSV